MEALFCSVCSAGPWVLCQHTPCWTHLCKLQAQRGAYHIIGAQGMAGNFKRWVSLSLVGWAGWTMALVQGRPDSTHSEEIGAARMKGTQGLRVYISKCHLITSCIKRLRYMHLKQALTFRKHNNIISDDLWLESSFVENEGNFRLAKALLQLLSSFLDQKSIFFEKCFKMSGLFHWFMEIKWEIRFLSTFFLTVKQSFFWKWHLASEYCLAGKRD